MRTIRMETMENIGRFFTLMYQAIIPNLEENWFFSGAELFESSINLKEMV